MKTAAIALCVLLSPITARTQDQHIAAPSTSDAAPTLCVSGVKSAMRARNQAIPAAIKPHLPSTAFVRMVLALSATDTLTIYELGNWGRYWERFDSNRTDAGELTDPDTQLLITRSGRPVFRLALKDVHAADWDDWGVGAVAMKAAHLCTNDSDMTYLVLQEGNAGGFYVALRRFRDDYRLLPVSDAEQGRLVLSVSRPQNAEVWTAAEPGVCTACPKRFEIRNYKFNGTGFDLVSRKLSKREYSGFQDDPLLVRH